MSFLLFTLTNLLLFGFSVIPPASPSLSIFPNNIYNSLSFCPVGGFTFYELMQRGVPLHLIDKYMNETKVVEEEK